MKAFLARRKQKKQFIHPGKIYSSIFQNGGHKAKVLREQFILSPLLQTLLLLHKTQQRQQNPCRLYTTTIVLPEKMRLPPENILPWNYVIKKDPYLLVIIGVQPNTYFCVEKKRVAAINIRRRRNELTFTKNISTLVIGFDRIL